MAGTSYTRQSSLTDGDTITASLFNDEYNQLVNAFAYAAAGTTGHQHDGGAGEGGNIEIIGDADFKNKIIVDSTNNRWSVFVEVGGTAVEQVRIEDGVVYPVTDSDVDLGTSALRFKAAYIDSITATTSLTLGTSITVSSILDEDDMSSNSATALATQQSIKAYVDSQVTAQDLDLTDGTTSISIDLDSEALSLLGGTGVTSTASGNGVTLAIDSTVATLTGSQTLTNKTLTSPDVNTPDIDGGTIDGAVIGGTTAAAGSFTTVDATGNITVGGTVDGRDVAADGTKLDGIEASATADQTDAEIRTAVEAASDSNVFTDADHTKLNAIEALADVTDVTNVTAAGALMDSELTSIASVKALDQGVATTDSPTFAAATVTGEITANGGIALGDNDKATFGAGDDLQIFHDGSVNRLDSVSSSLAIKAPQFVVQDAGGTKNMIWVPQGGSGYEVQLSHDGTTKLTTTSTGIDVTGTATMDGLTVNSSLPNIYITESDTTDLNTRLALQGGVQYLASVTDDLATTKNRISWDNATGDISFYEDTGTTPKLVWDASAESLTIPEWVIHDGNTSTKFGFGSANTMNFISNGSDRLTIANSYAVFNEAGTDYDFRVESNDNTHMLFVDGGNNRVGIGTSSPSELLTVVGNSQFATPTVLISDTDTSVQLNQVIGKFAVSVADNSAPGTGVKTSIQTVALNSLGGHYGMTFHTTNTDGNDTERMRIDSAGNVGIGTDSPESKVHLRNTSGDTTLRIESGGVNGDRAGIRFQNSNDDSNHSGGIYCERESGILHSLTFETYGSGGTGTERMRIDSSGNVGIGTTPETWNTSFIPMQIGNSGYIYGRSAQTAMEIGNNAYFGGSGWTYTTTNTAQRYIQDSTDNAHKWFNAASGTAEGSLSWSERMRIDSSGRVGIGTSSPLQALHVNSGTGNSAAIFESTDSTSQIWLKDSASSTTYQTGLGCLGDNLLFNNGGERMRIDSSGNVGIGTSNPDDLLVLSKATYPTVKLNDTGLSSSLILQTHSGNSEHRLTGTGAYPLVFRTNDTERMRIDSNGNVGIGTSSPVSPLQIQNADPQVIMTQTAGGVNRFLAFDVGLAADVDTQFITVDQADNLAFGEKLTASDRVIENEWMRIDSSGRVGIGTSSPSSYEFNTGTTTVVKGATNSTLSIISATTGLGYLAFGDGTSGLDRYRGMLEYAHSDDSLRVRTAGTERMRIDSSGNLLVGTTSDLTDAYLQGGGVGIALRSNDQLAVSRSGSTVAQFNRNTNDGDIVSFRKDGTTVGSIAYSSGNFRLDGSGLGLHLNGSSNAIYPSNGSGSLNDGVVNLGLSSSRFKDLHLSGNAFVAGNVQVTAGNGILLGGAAAANKLEDYETGTFNAKLTGTTGEPSTLLLTAAHYTKIGQTVHVRIGFENITTTGYAGDVNITDLPFTNRDGRTLLQVMHYQAVTWSANYQLGAIMSNNSNVINLMGFPSGGVWSAAQHNTAGTGRYIWVTGTYQTDA